MNAAVGLMDGLGLDGDRCIRVIPQHFPDETTTEDSVEKDVKKYKHSKVPHHVPEIHPDGELFSAYTRVSFEI